MTKQISLERIIRKRTWMSFVIAFPEDFEAREKQACVTLFDTSDRVRFTPFSPGYQFDYSDPISKCAMEFTIQDTFRRDGYMFMKYLHEKASQGGPHIIGYGYPRIGLDILCVELTSDDNGSLITDAYLLQNAIPTELTQSQSEDTVLNVVMTGFFASNEKVTMLADNYIKAQLAAQKQKSETAESQTSILQQDSIVP